MMIESCSEVCGWVAALIACIAHGSYPVPMKGTAANSVKVDPFVFQTYKTSMCFMLCWTVLLLGERFSYSPWGILSGLLWNVGGTSYVFAVRSAGLASSVGISSGVTVSVSFIWGIFIFDEKLKSKPETIAAISFMITGILGMSYFSTPTTTTEKQESKSSLSPSPKRSCENDDDLLYALLENESSFAECKTENIEASSSIESLLRPDEVDVYCSSSSDQPLPNTKPVLVPKESIADDQMITICRVRVTRRSLGLAAAVSNGIFSGSSLVPMHYSRKDTHGLGYVISFAIGALLTNTMFWIIRYLYHVPKTRSFRAAFEELPSFHLRVLWIPGCISGTLWTIYNISSIVSVTFLGEGVGYSVVQSQLIVSGIWGIVWFREIRMVRNIFVWFVSALVTLSGILLLFRDHER